MNRLDLSDVVGIACELLATDAHDLLGVLDVDAVIDALAASAAERTLPIAVAELVGGLAPPGVLPSGSTRLALLAASVLCERNGCVLDCAVEMTRKMLAGVASGATTSAEIADWALASIRPRRPRSTATVSADPAERADLLGLYLADVGRQPLLSKVEEIALAERIEAGRAAKTRFAEGTALDATERSAIRREIASGEAAEKELVQGNLRLVVAIARRYLKSGRPMLELIQEGNLGLLQAVEKFDWRKGFKFSTYATWWIRQAITRSLANAARPPLPPPTVDLPPEVAELLEGLSPEERETLVLRFGLDRAEPRTLDEVARHFATTAERIREIEQRAMRRLRGGSTEGPEG